MDDLIKLNKDIHNNVADSYDQRHIEIYNPREQDRLSVLIEQCRELIGNHSAATALDFGSGTGNLTKHLLSQGFQVTAADVSEKSLEVLSTKFDENSSKLNLQQIDGETLNVFPDNSFDLVSTYSVLHHVPDYLSIVEEFGRVAKPGGLIYIDHEVCPEYWMQSVEYKNYRNELDRSTKELSYYARKIRKIFSRNAWKRLYFRYLSNSGINEEGDIHVHPHDHIEWDEIKKILLKIGTVVKEEDYLVCREMDAKIWEIWKDKCVDMRYLIVRKAT